MRRPKAQPTELYSWNVYEAAGRARWLGWIDAYDEKEALTVAAKEYRKDPKRLIVSKHKLKTVR